MIKGKRDARNLSIADNMPSTVTYDGQIWKVSDRRIKGKFLCEGEDGMKNPKSRLVRTKWLSPKDFVKEEESLKAEYNEVVMSWAWDVTSLFREKINVANKEKDIEETAVQREFKNGEWNVVNPIDLENELKNAEDEIAADAPSSRAKRTLKEAFVFSKTKVIALWIFIAALVAAGIVLLSRARP